MHLRVRNCVTCHIGDSEHEVNHDLIAAGHPHLLFEFAAYQRQKAEAMADFTQRSWAVGQTVSLEAVAELLATRVERAVDNLDSG